MNPGGSSQNSHTSKKGVRQSKTRKIPVVRKEKQNLKLAVSSVKENDKDEQYRSGSLSRHKPLKVQESPRKAQSMDRYQSTRKIVKDIESKNHAKKNSTKAINPAEGEKGFVKSDNISTKHESRRNNSVNTKSSVKSEKNKYTDNLSRTSKAIKPKTNLQIAKSFVQSSQVKSQNLTKTSDNSKATAKKQDVNKPAHTTGNDSILERPRTSTIQKGPTESVNSQSEFEIPTKGATPSKRARSKNSFSGESDSDKASYEEDFEDYDSDFEESDSESISETGYSDEDDNISNNQINESIPESLDLIKASNLSPELKPPIVLPRKITEKTFLKLSDRSSLFSEKNSSSVDTKPIKLSRSYINFESAIAADENIKNHQELNESSNELESKNTYLGIHIMDNLHESYKYIAKSTVKQVCLQTENCEEEEIQTDEIELLNKWTQNPTNGTIGYGGDQISLVEDKSAAWKSLFHVHSTKLSMFLQRSSNIILTLLEEESTSFHIESNMKRSDFMYSDGYYIISPLNFLSGIPVVNMYCCIDSSPYIITIHGDMVQLPSSNDIVDDKGVICVWNILESTKPEYILTSNSQPTCGTFGPGGSDIVIGGMVDGAVMLWDLSDLNSNNLQVESDGPLSFRAPTYNTAVVLGPENHNSCIVGIQSVYKSAKSDWRSSGLERTDSLKSFHVLTLEDMGVINIWVVVEVLKPDLSGLESDFGLAPGGKFRLVKSACLPLHSLTTLQLEQKTSIRTFDFRLVPYDSSRILVTTDAGIILHVTRHSGIIEPRYYSSEADFNFEVRCIDCSPHNEDLFLVGCSDGSIKLYSVKLVRPMLEFLQASKGEPVNLLQWSIDDPCVFGVLSSSSHIRLWNLMKDTIYPIYSYHFEDCKVTWFVFKKRKQNSHDATSSGLSNFIIAKESGEIEVHNFRQNVMKQDYRMQYEYMQNL